MADTPHWMLRPPCRAVNPVVANSPGKHKRRRGLYQPSEARRDCPQSFAFTRPVTANGSIHSFTQGTYARRPPTIRRLGLDQVEDVLLKGRGLGQFLEVERGLRLAAATGIVVPLPVVESVLVFRKLIEPLRLLHRRRTIHTHSLQSPNQRAQLILNDHPEDFVAYFTVLVRQHVPQPDH